MSEEDFTTIEDPVDLELSEASDGLPAGQYDRVVLLYIAYLSSPVEEEEAISCVLYITDASHQCVSTGAGRDHITHTQQYW